MKKIFILTGEASGDKLASTVVEKIQKHVNISLLTATAAVGLILVAIPALIASLN